MRVIAGITLICIAAGGCAGGGLLDRTIGDAELPVDAPANPYPTAIRNGVASSNRQPGLPAPAAATPNAATTNTPATQQPAANVSHLQQTRMDFPQPLNTPLAVIPPQLVKTTAHPPLEPVPRAPTVDQRQTLVDLTPATNWTPPTVVHARISDDPEPEVTPTVAVEKPRPASHKSADTEVKLASATASISAASDHSSSEDDRRAKVEQARTALMEALEAEIKDRRSAGANDADLSRLEQQLRLAYVSAGRLDDAVASIESLDAPQSEAFKELMFGLGVWMSPDESSRVPLRSAKVLHSLRDATSELAAAGKLEVRNLVFCERVDTFGWYTEFPRKEFQPRQQVILYAEVENFAAEYKGGTGYETELHGSYVILDSSGQEVASRALQPDKEVCRNHRRDYFLAYRMYMPEGIAPGKYRLELTVEDLKAKGKYQGRKLGEGVIEFAIR